MNVPFQVDGRTCKTGFQLLWEQVEPYTLEHAAEVCELDSDQIEKAIRLYAEHTPSGIALGVSTDQTPNSEQAAMPLESGMVICSGRALA